MKADLPRDILWIFATFILVSSCAVLARNEYRPVAKGDDWRVRLVKYATGSDTVTRGGFQHPFDISLLKLNNILASIYIKDNNLLGTNNRRQLFPARVRKIMLAPLQKAFQTARPDEVIDFSFMMGKSFLWIFNHDYFTSGIFFKKDGRLNLVMRTVNFQCDNFQSALRQFAGDPTKRALKEEWSFVLQPGMSLKRHRVEGLDLFQAPYYFNWLIIDIDRQYRQFHRKTRKARRFQAPAPIQEAPPRIQYNAPAHAAGPQAPKSIDDPEIRKKLQVLRQLYNSGAISRSTYERKKDELLSP